jgi:hypothetical protein
VIVFTGSTVIGAVLGLIVGAVFGPLAACLAAAVPIGSFWGFEYGTLVASPIVFAKDRILVAFSTAFGAALGAGTGLGCRVLLPSLFGSSSLLRNIIVGVLGGVAMSAWYVFVRVVRRPFISLD